MVRVTISFFIAKTETMPVQTLVALKIASAALKVAQGLP